MCGNENISNRKYLKIFYVIKFNVNKIVLN